MNNSGLYGANGDQSFSVCVKAGTEVTTSGCATNSFVSTCN